MEAACASKTLPCIYQTIRFYISEYCNLNIHQNEILTSHILNHFSKSEEDCQGHSIPYADISLISYYDTLVGNNKNCNNHFTYFKFYILFPVQNNATYMLAFAWLKNSGVYNKYLCRYSNEKQPCLFGVSSVVDYLTAIKTRMTVKHFLWNWITCEWRKWFQEVRNKHVPSQKHSLNQSWATLNLMARKVASLVW